MVHWYKRDPDAALAGMLGLTLEERGIYNTLIDLLYARDGDVPNDDHYLAMVCGCHWRTFRALKNRLIAKDKLIILEGGKITARRVQECLKEASRFVQEQSKNSNYRWKSTKFLKFGDPSTSTSTTTSKDLSFTSKEEDTARAIPHNDTGKVHVRIDSPHWKTCSERFRKQHHRWPPQDDAFGWHFPAEWIIQQQDEAAE